MRSRFIGVFAFVAVLVAGCGPSTSLGTAIQPRQGRAGVQVTGQLAGIQIALSEGAPELVVGDCDPLDGPDNDVCAIASDIGGTLFVLVFENPAVLEAGKSVTVSDTGCALASCDDVTDVAIVAVQYGLGERSRAEGGQVYMEQVEPFLRYVGTAQLRLPTGDLSVSFDLVPRGD